MLALVAVLAAAAAAFLALPSGASATTELSDLGQTLQALGTGEADNVTVRFKPDANGLPIVQIFDPGGIPDPLPPGCTRKDEFTVVCPGHLYNAVNVNSGSGNDTIIFDFGLFFPFSAPRANFLSTGFGIVMDGGYGNDSESMIGSLPATEIGGAGNDTLTGGAGPDNLMGGPGNDHLSGQAGDDVLGGGPGNDKLKGGSGNDTLSCGGGTDQGIGGSGKDKSKGCEQGKA